MKSIILALGLLLLISSTDANAERIFRKRGTATRTYSTQPADGSQRQYLGGHYANCQDYVQKAEGGNYGPFVGNASKVGLQPGDVVHTGSHWMRIEAVNGNTVTISHSNFSFNRSPYYKGKIVENRTYSSLSNTNVYRN